MHTASSILAVIRHYVAAPLVQHMSKVDMQLSAKQGDHALQVDCQ